MKQFLLFGFALMLLACDKKELDTSTLNTNTLDPDFTGPSMIEFHSGTVTFVQNDLGVVIDTVYTLKVHVMVERFPRQTVYDIVLREPGTANINEQDNVQGDNPDIFALDYHHAVPGNTYCLTAQILVDGSGSAVWGLCHAAQ